jgi:signal transduction histidine kinase/ABC-type amino acid transport substrate-binding protein
MAVKAKTEAPLIKELGTAQKKLSSFIYFGLLPLLLLIVAPLFAGLANSTGNAATDLPEVRVGSELEFPPYAFVDESGRPAGFSVDLIKAVADVMGLSIKISTGPWDTVWNELVAGRLDVLPIVAKLPERQRLVDFSLPHTETYDAFFVRQGNPQIQNIEAATGKEIAVMRSDAAHHVLLERNFQGQLILVDTIPEGLSLISSGKHDAFLCSKLIGTMAIKKHGLRKLTAGPLIPDYNRFFSFAVKKGDAELLEKLNQGLLIIKTNRQYDQIYDKWLTPDDPWRKMEKHLWPAIVIVIAIALIVGFWLVTLQLLVKKRTRQLSESNEMLRLAQEGLEERVAQRTVELANANVALQSEINERKRAEEALMQRTTDLTERVKELECLYGISKLFAESDNSVDELLEEAVHLIPPGWCYPGITCARIALEEQEFITDNFRETPWKLSADIVISRKTVGMVEACYLEERPTFDEGPFLKEEKDLINGLARQIGAIVERKQAESEIQSLAKFPSENPNPVLRIARDGTLLYANEAALSKLPETPLQVGQRVQSMLQDVTSEALNSGLTRSLDLEHGERVYLFFAAPVAAAGYANLYGHDITERKRAEEALRKRTAELELANRELEAFSYSVSHDLKAPIRAIQGFSRMLVGERASGLDEEGLRMLNVIVDNTQIMAKLIDDLLALARLGRHQIRKSALGLADMIRQDFERLRAEGLERDLQLTLSDLPKAWGDHSLINQVMMNLLGNAIKYTKAKKTAIIEVGGYIQGQETIYYVKDNGIGFDERYADKLFGVFQRLHGGPEYEGAGVGLAIVELIIHRHGGRVWAEGRVGEGATFYFALPKNEE